MKGTIPLLCFLMVTASAFSQTKDVRIITVEIHHAVSKGGTVNVSVSFSKETYDKRKPDRTIQYEPADSIVKTEITVPAGDCVINVYQDRNGNGKCDNNFLGIPKEPVGISNWNGKGVPGNFNRHKVNIDDNTQTITVNLYQL